MKKTLVKAHISLLAVMALIAMTFGACSSDPGEEIIPGEDDGVINLHLNVELGLGSASRAGNEPDGFEGPDGVDEEIESIRVIILRSSSQQGFSYEVDAARLVATNAQGVPLNDNLNFKVRGNEMKTIVLIANENSLPSPDPKFATARDFLDQFLIKGADISTEDWSKIRDWTVGMPGNNPTATQSLFSNYRANSVSKSHIPLTEMFQVQTINTTPTTASGDAMTRDEETQEVTLFLTRCAAKATFEFKVDKDNTNPYQGSGMTVTAIRFWGFNWDSYVFPRDAVYTPAKYTNEGPGYPNFIGNVAPDGTVRDASQTLMNRYLTSFATILLTAGGATFDYTFDQPVEIKSYIGQTPPTRGPIYFSESKKQVADGQSLAADDANKAEVGSGASRYPSNYTLQLRLDTGEWLSARPIRTNILQITENGKTFDAIARNTHLKIVITFGQGGEIYWEAIEAPYNSVVLEPVFGLTVPAE